MNKTHLKDSLINTAETEVTVSVELHRDIMRAVRLAEPVRKRSAFHAVIPALGAVAMAVFAIAVFINRPQAIEVSPLIAPQQGISQSISAATPLKQLADELLILSKNSTLPEQELRKELERLKSDLERFDFRS